MTVSERRFLYTQTIYIYTAERTLVCWEASVLPAYCWLQFRYLCVCVCVCVCSGGLGEQAVNPFSAAPSHTFERLALFIFVFLIKAFDSVLCGPRGDIKNKRSCTAVCLPVHSNSGYHPQFIATTSMEKQKNKKTKSS